MVSHLSVSIPSSPGSPTSPPSLTTSSPASPHRTNTLVITRLPPAFFAPVVQQALRSHFETYGPLHTWAPIKGLARVIMVYYSEEDAETAKESNDGLILGDMQDHPDLVLRVYRADPTPIETSETQEHNHYLRPPTNEKNFLISPPGSPPVGWEQIREDPPNATPLANDLIAALRKLELQTEQERRGPGPEVLLEPEDGVGISVYVEDCDATAPAPEEYMEEDWVYGEAPPSRLRWRPLPTSMPPVSVMT
ncbi:Calcipressin [Trametes punicea]|nr:Calcipressin [Trametes punicea]KAI8999140.1 Calcipressin [Trametes punicea]